MLPTPPYKTPMSVDYPGVRGKRYLVTGASSGIGRATALLLAGLGAKVIITGRDEVRLTETFTQLEGQGHTSAVADLCAIPSMRAWVEDLARKTNGANGTPLAGLAHCAGRHHFVPMRAYTSQTLQNILLEYTVSSADLIHGFASSSVLAPQSSIAVMSSISVHFASKGNALYALARAAIGSFVKNIAIEFASRGIRCNSVMAGHISDTAMTDTFLEYMGPELKKIVEKKYTLGFGECVDAANAIAFLLGSASRWITGTELLLDGGFSVQGG